MSARPRVYILDAADSPLCAEMKIEDEILGNHAELIFTPIADGESFPADVFDADALIVSHFPRVTERLLQSFRKLRIIVRNGVGYDNVDAEAAGRLGIPVCNVPDYGTEEVADYAILLTLALQRNFYPALNDVRNGNWSWRVAEPGRRLRGQKFGIIGCGRIGSATALRAKALGFSVQFYDPYIVAGYEKAIGVARCSSMEELLRSSDVVSLHCPLSDSTRGLIGTQELQSMKKGAFLVNTARGPLVQEAGLREALRTNHLAGAALDVLENEPLFSPELLSFPNCLLTPHIAFYSADSTVEARGSAARNVLRCLQSSEPMNIVNHIVPSQSEMPMTR